MADERSAKLKAQWIIGKYCEFPLKREIKHNKREIQRKTRRELKREINTEVTGEDERS